MKKTVILIRTIVLGLVVIISYNIYSYQRLQEQAKKENKLYEDFYNVEVLGTDIASLMNKIEDSNNRNGVEKNKKGLNLNNDTNSINLEIKFLGLDDVINFENIEKQGINSFVKYFGAMKFKCTKIEYHQNTGNVKYMYFEQV